MYIIIQEGGSSREIYAHGWNTLKECRHDRKDCAKGSYRTSEPIRVPQHLSKLLKTDRQALEDFWKTIDDTLKASLDLK